ncbi:phage integrase SAM-like domain-containing protein, partial [Parabacteroides sp.]
MKKSKNKHLLLSECINERVESKRLMKKNSTADLYLVAGHHFLNFIEKNDILLPEITPTMVCDFQTYLQTKELKINTLNSYLSSLRAVFNAVLNDRPFKIKKHPFQHMKLKRDV